MQSGSCGVSGVSLGSQLAHQTLLVLGFFFLGLSVRLITSTSYTLLLRKKSGAGVVWREQARMACVAREKKIDNSLPRKQLKWTYGKILLIAITVPNGFAAYGGERG
jgi:hypothetical protein